MTYLPHLISAALLCLPSLALAEGPNRTKPAAQAAPQSTAGVHYTCTSFTRGEGFEIRQDPGAFMAELDLGSEVHDAFVATGGGRISFVAVVGSSAYNFSVDPEGLSYFGSKSGAGGFSDFGTCTQVS
ncbi:MAG: hypothetical protein HRU31_04045 [Rhodobacteraceae bacterium]|nr:hypothetical protein [Paracoccaceae bacterium]